MKTPLRFVILFISFAFLSTSCKKTTTTTNEPPALTTNDVILDVTSTTAQSGGTITSIGSSSITANGVCYSSTNKIPTISDLKTTDPVISSSYSFTSNITGLNPSTTYYLRAYATNAYGTAYGSVVTFSTTATSNTIAGAVTTFAGNATGGYADGVGAAAQFSYPIGIASDAHGNIYVSDSFNNRIRKIASDGTVTTVAGNGTAGLTPEGPAANAEFYGPQGLAVDGQGNIFVADFGNNVIRKISTTGTVTTFAGNGIAGYVDGAATVAEFNGPAGLAFDKQGNLYVADNNNNMIRKITSAGVVSRVAGTKTPGYVNGTVNTTTGVYTSFRSPNGLVVDASGNIFVADLGNSAIRQITSAGVVTTIAGGPGQTSLLGSPGALAMDASGNFFITDESGRVVELNSAKVLYPLAGTTNVAGFADGTGTAAKFNTPQGICVDASGNIFVADFNNNRIRKVVVVDTSNP
jgi:sugar lactone lactonase YvrE